MTTMLYSPRDAAIVMQGRRVGGSALAAEVAASRGFADIDAPPRPLNRKGGDPNEWPTDLRVREWPEVTRG